MAQARIVLATFGSLGDVHPFLALARGLQDRGHSVVVATLEWHRRKVEEAGIPFHAIGPDISEFGDEATFMSQVMDQKKGFEFVIRGVVMPNLKRSYREICAVADDADVVVTHPLTYSAQLFAEKNATKMAWVSVALAPSGLWSAYDPPVTGQLPWLAKLHPFGPRFFRPVMSALKKGLDRWVKPWHAFRAELNLPKTRRNPIFEAQFSPRLTLCLFSPLFGRPQLDWPSSAHATGFAFYDSPKNSELSSQLEAFLRDGEAPVVFTLGSSAVMDAGDFYVQSAKAATMLGKRAVLLVGSDPRNQPKEKLPSNMIAPEYAPYARVFPHASAIVHQGGIGTTAEALRAGKPMLVVPFGFDQFDNAARIVALGIGRTISRKKYLAETVVNELRLLFDKPTPGALASQLGSAISAEDGIGNACRAIESQLSMKR